MVPPAVEHARHLGGAHARREQAVEQVEVLGPVEVAPAADTLECRARGRARSGGARGQSTNASRSISSGSTQPVQPLGVEAEAVAQAARAERLDLAAGEPQLRAAREELGLRGQPLGVRLVVRVHARDQAAARGGEPVAERGAIPRAGRCSTRTRGSRRARVVEQRRRCRRASRRRSQISSKLGPTLASVESSAVRSVAAASRTGRSTEISGRARATPPVTCGAIVAENPAAPGRGEPRLRSRPLAVCLALAHAGCMALGPRDLHLAERRRARARSSLRDEVPIATERTRPRVLAGPGGRRRRRPARGRGRLGV